MCSEEYKTCRGIFFLGCGWMSIFQVPVLLMCGMTLTRPGKPQSWQVTLSCYGTYLQSISSCGFYFFISDVILLRSSKCTQILLVQEEEKKYSSWNSQVWEHGNCEEVFQTFKEENKNIKSITNKFYFLCYILDLQLPCNSVFLKC